MGDVKYNFDRIEGDHAREREREEKNRDLDAKSEE